MNAIGWMRIRIWLRRVAAWCDRDFDRARGVPRQATLRDQMDLARKARGARHKDKT